jgi:hypothetical protein
MSPLNTVSDDDTASDWSRERVRDGQDFLPYIHPLASLATHPTKTRSDAFGFLQAIGPSTLKLIHYVQAMDMRDHFRLK